MSWASVRVSEISPKATLKPVIARSEIKQKPEKD